MHMTESNLPNLHLAKISDTTVKVSDGKRLQIPMHACVDVLIITACIILSAITVHCKIR